MKTVIYTHHSISDCLVQYISGFVTLIAMWTVWSGREKLWIPSEDRARKRNQFYTTHGTDASDTNNERILL